MQTPFDNARIACLISKRDVCDLEIHIFLLLMKLEARSWHNSLPQASKLVLAMYT